MQAVESRLKIARVLAEQWFGVFMRAKTQADAWLLKGLAGWLEDQFVRKFMGKNEYVYRQGCPASRTDDRHGIFTDLS